MSTILARHADAPARLPILAASISDHLRAANAATRRGVEILIGARREP